MTIKQLCALRNAAVQKRDNWRSLCTGPNPKHVKEACGKRDEWQGIVRNLSQQIDDAWESRQCECL